VTAGSGARRVAPRPDILADALAVAAERLGGHAAGVLVRLAGPIGHAARDAAAELARLPADARKQRRADSLARARTPVAPGLRAMHPSWIEAVLDELPARARGVLAEGATDATDVWLARWATAQFPTTTGSDDRDLLAWLTGIGADQFAFALGEQAGAIPALAGAVVRIATPPRLGGLGPQRAAIARCRGVSLDDALAFVRVACRALAPHFADAPLARLQLIRRLPRPIGIVVERELAAHEATPFDQCPTWAALDAR
jgi:hypothetical protein